MFRNLDISWAILSDTAGETAEVQGKKFKLKWLKM